MINKIIGPLFIILMFFNCCFSQIDTVNYKIYLNEYSVLRGQIISQDSDSIRIYTTLGKNITLSKNDIKKIQNGRYGRVVDTKRDLLNIGYMVDNAYLVPKGRLVFTSSFLIFSKIQYGFTDNITLQAGAFFMPNYDYEIVNVPGLRGFYHKRVNEKLEVAGSFGAYVEWNGNSLLNSIGAIFTYGRKEKNISLGVNKLISYSGSLTEGLPIYDMSVKYTYRPIKKVAIGVESNFSKYIDQYKIFLVPSIDFYFKSSVISLTLNAQKNNVRSSIIPFIGFKLPVIF